MLFRHWNKLNNELEIQSIPEVNIILAGNGFDNDETRLLYFKVYFKTDIFYF